MKYLVTVSDDFGFSSGVNKGTIESFEEGILKEMSLMMDSFGTDEAVRWAKVNNVRSIGIHLTLNDLKGTGVYLRTPDYEKMLSELPKEELIEKVSTEIRKFEDALGFAPSFVNAHHSAHQHPKIADFIAEYAGKHKIWVRKAARFTDGKSIGVSDMDAIDKQFTAKGAKMTDHIFEHIQGSYEESKQSFLKDLSGVQDNSTTEAFFHPAYLDDLQRKYTSLLDERERDLRLLKDPEFKEKIEEIGFRITNFSLS